MTIENNNTKLPSKITNTKSQRFGAAQKSLALIGAMAVIWSLGIYKIMVIIIQTKNFKALECLRIIKLTNAFLKIWALTKKQNKANLWQLQLKKKHIRVLKRFRNH